VFRLANERDQLRVPLESAVAIAYSATSYKSWASRVQDLGLTTSQAVELVTEAVSTFSFQ